ncbi:hypothetical protein [Sporolactobacillus nakayamae]|uniref:Uncharacterized protein n=1 Tax=Sporolactobacillus nakayamae TaxID=269670 RepID=A0A1I2P0A0_9BACL|nr:hypothetical protein [Sporolactobacillus nakayamae]SFG09514.1 hypothetical protein SAMN02982927_00652 [Sporolactobacillus nakayamae]
MDRLRFGSLFRQVSDEIKQQNEEYDQLQKLNVARSKKIKELLQKKSEKFDAEFEERQKEINIIHKK